MRYEPPKNLKEAIKKACSAQEILKETKNDIEYFFYINVAKDDETFWINLEGATSKTRYLVTKKQLKNMFDERIRQLSEEYEKCEKIVKMYCECKNEEEATEVYRKLTKKQWGIKD